MNKSSTLRIYAVALLVIGLASAFYSAETSAFGWNFKGKSGLIADGSAAVLAFVLSFYAAKNLRWAHWAGAILAFMFLIIGFRDGFMTARGISAGTEPEYHWYKATLFGATALVSMAALMPILMWLRQERSSAVE